MDFLSKQVLLFVGPPSVGKTLFFKNKLAGTHVLFSPKEEIAKDKQLGLRQLALKVVKLLKQGKKVAVDGENKTRKLRKCYIHIIKEKVPDCSIAIVLFRPKYGMIQLQWAQAFSQADDFFTGKSLKDDEDLPSTEKQFKSWLNALSGIKNADDDDGPEMPKEYEGCTVGDISLRLEVETGWKFEVPGLFIEWQSLLNARPSEQLAIETGAVEAVEAWYTKYTCGRVIIIFDGRKGTRRDQKESKLQQMEDTLIKFSEQIQSCPIYALCVENREIPGDFAEPLGPNLIAFAQRLHHLGLQNKGSVYLYTSQEHLHCATAAGVKHIKASKAFSNPAMMVSGYGVTTPSTPPLLADVGFISSSSRGSHQAVPLAEDEEALTNRKWTCVKLGFRRKMFLFCRDIGQLESYIQDYKHYRTPIDERGSRIAELNHNISEPVQTPRKTPTVFLSDKTRDLPKWMLCKKKKMERSSGMQNVSEVSSTLDLDCDDPDDVAEQSVKRSRICHTVYVMDEDELMQTAQMVLKEAGQVVGDIVDEHPQNSLRSRVKGTVKEIRDDHSKQRETVSSSNECLKMMQRTEIKRLDHLDSHSMSVNSDMPSQVHSGNYVNIGSNKEHKQSAPAGNMSTILDGIISKVDKRPPPKSKRKSVGRISPGLLDFTIDTSTADSGSISNIRYDCKTQPS
ncbi:uncharacterized protein LOC106158479 isoform X1 [Lingula anatina]|uniref:Uncharacterized protein LOC106158479 isoform X1 n=1 Tax=Lingula anatina TaxID=7574 RepID=A0A1S3HWL7_LINAN|nr:uncharacterized protein LOC106158479 isoform X1 [Lingula anatina]|eukprot:XP_013389946.1 uncharacterized protein LOC106158479 isoform X1 [Lingula anatina]